MEKSWNFLWIFWHFWPSQMNFGKVKGLYEVLFLNYQIKWGRFCPSKLGHNFLVFQIFVNFGAIFTIKSCEIDWLNILMNNLEICWGKTQYFLKMEKMPKIVLPISLYLCDAKFQCFTTWVLSTYTYDYLIWSNLSQSKDLSYLKK